MRGRGLVRSSHALVCGRGLVRSHATVCGRGLVRGRGLMSGPARMCVRRLLVRLGTGRDRLVRRGYAMRRSSWLLPRIREKSG
jgi:hypothetical protein